MIFTPKTPYIRALIVLLTLGVGGCTEQSAPELSARAVPAVSPAQESSRPAGKGGDSSALQVEFVDLETFTKQGTVPGEMPFHTGLWAKAATDREKRQMTAALRELAAGFHARKSAPLEAALATEHPFRVRLVHDDDLFSPQLNIYGKAAGFISCYTSVDAPPPHCSQTFGGHITPKPPVSAACHGLCCRLEEGDQRQVTHSSLHLTGACFLRSQETKDADSQQSDGSLLIDRISLYEG